VKINELMRTDVIAVTPDTSLKDAAALLVQHRISGLPVVDEEKTVVGVLSEADILVKEGGPSERAGLLSWILGDDVPGYAAKIRARTVGEAMTAPPITISPHRLVASAAREMVEQGVNRLPVVDLHGTLLGIVTRADLVRAFVRSDAEIEREIREETLRRVLWLEPTAVTVAVHDGEVELSGRVETTDDVELLEKLVARTPGVVAVRSQLTHRTNGR
jgi:CBS domain-containing protein